MDNKEQHAKGVKQSLETMIGTDLSLKRKKKSENDHYRELFNKVIIALEQANVRSEILGEDMKIDLTNYDEEFYTAIDNLILIAFGKEAAEVIFYYVYDRINPDGSVNELRDNEDKPVILNNPSDLWDLVMFIKSKNASPKTNK